MIELPNSLRFWRESSCSAVAIARLVPPGTFTSEKYKNKEFSPSALFLEGEIPEQLNTIQPAEYGVNYREHPKEKHLHLSE